MRTVLALVDRRRSFNGALLPRWDFLDLKSMTQESSGLNQAVDNGGMPGLAVGIVDGGHDIAAGFDDNIKKVDCWFSCRREQASQLIRLTGAKDQLASPISVCEHLTCEDTRMHNRKSITFRQLFSERIYDQKPLDDLSQKLYDRCNR